MFEIKSNPIPTKEILVNILPHFFLKMNLSLLGMCKDFLCSSEQSSIKRLKIIWTLKQVMVWNSFPQGKLSTELGLS